MSDASVALRTYRQILDSELAFAPAHYCIGLTYEQLGEVRRGDAARSGTRPSSRSSIPFATTAVFVISYALRIGG